MKREKRIIMTNQASCRRIPLRTCLGCRTTRNKTDLIRVVRTPEAQVKLDPTGRMNGRGAYLCRDAACLRKAAKNGALSRALGVQVPEQVLKELALEISGGDGTV